MGYQSRIKFDAAGPFKVRRAFIHDGTYRQFGEVFEAAHLPIETRRHMFDCGLLDMIGPIASQATPTIEYAAASQPGNTPDRTSYKKRR